MASRTNRVLTDHDEIRRWAEERDASPACVRGTGGDNDIGMLRLDFPGYTGARSLEHIDWNEWLDKFDERGLALLVQDRTARGERSNFNKIVSRETAEAARNGRSRSSSRSSRTSAGRRTHAASTSRTRTVSNVSKKTSKKSAPKKKRTARKSASRKSSSSRSSRANASRGTSRKTSGVRSRTSRKSSASTRSESTRARRSTGTRASSRRSKTAQRGNVRSIESGRRSASSHVLTDHDEIRRWAEERGAAPACVRGTGGAKDPGMIRLDFPGFSGARSLEHIDWDEWFRAFDENGLALLVQDTRAGGGRSNFNKLIARETAEQRARGESKASRRHPEKAATSRTRASSSNKSTKKATRGSTRARRTESVRGRTTSHRRAA